MNKVCVNSRDYALIMIVLLALANTGCSTMAQVGEVEGLGQTGEILREIERTRVVLGGTPHSPGAAPAINRKVGEAKQLPDKTSVSSIIQSIQYILE